MIVYHKDAFPGGIFCKQQGDMSGVTLGCRGVRGQQQNFEIIKSEADLALQPRQVFKRTRQENCKATTDA